MRGRRGFGVLQNRSIMNTLLVVLTILIATGKPVPHVWVEVEGDQSASYYMEGKRQGDVWVEKVTDSWGQFAVEVEPGIHAVTVSREGDVLVSSQLNTDATHTTFTFYTGE